MEAAAPAVDILTMLTTLVRYRDDTQKSITEGYDLIVDTLDCLRVPDYAVMVGLSLSQYEIVYDVAVKPIEGSSYVSFKVTFRVQP